ncbi:MAG: hypothetical protein M8467_14045 [Anaerolineae bacterium]|nr:hypothetical protein [Anaerolineae bacterium]
MNVRELGESILAAGAIAGVVVLSPLLQSWYRRWGATETELQLGLPGDRQVPNPKIETTRAITISAPAERIWPWLVQMGQGRGGLYSYEMLENLIGSDIHNADRILPEHQELEVGDKVRLGPEGYPFFTVTEIVPNRALVLAGGPQPPEDDAVQWSWVFVLEETDGEDTRLIARNRTDYPPSLPNWLIWRVFTDPIAFVMERRMLREIKKRAELAVHPTRQS